ncbi:helix-turn-helix domain-containing protein [Nocardia farcinica]|uniref:helix-turn-helix domain-containing protein n=1 Tax=Nocardia farcinica TaxID=37329 RepID=UPI002458868B|nr:helix-turn-helix transcriptional regulator [Nocardia farcinica]
MDPMDLATAEAVRSAIREADLTESTVAIQAGIKPSTWYRRMHGRRPFRVSEVIKIARVIGVKAGDLLDGVSEKKS